MNEKKELTAEVEEAAKKKFDRLASAFRDLHKLVERVAKASDEKDHIMKELHIGSFPDLSNCVRMHAMPIGTLSYFSGRIATTVYDLISKGTVTAHELSAGFVNKDWNQVLEEAEQAFAAAMLNDGIPCPNVYVAEIRDLSNVVGMTRLESIPTIWNTCVLAHNEPLRFAEMF